MKNSLLKITTLRNKITTTEGLLINLTLAFLFSFDISRFAFAAENFIKSTFGLSIKRY